MDVDEIQKIIKESYFGNEMAFPPKTLNWTSVAAKKIQEHFIQLLKEHEHCKEWHIIDKPEGYYKLTCISYIIEHSLFQPSSKMSKTGFSTTMEVSHEPSADDSGKKQSDYCPDCGGLIDIRNPTGKCDHLYYPEYKSLSQPSNLQNDAVGIHTPWSGDARELSGNIQSVSSEKADVKDAAEELAVRLQ